MKIQSLTSRSMTVDLFVRSWVEISHKRATDLSSTSTSSWGRELKYKWWYYFFRLWNVDLFVRSWVEMAVSPIPSCFFVVDLFVRSWVEIHNWLVQLYSNYRRPLREVVSWNINPCCAKTYINRRPLREVVSWNIKGIRAVKLKLCRPLREVVSWNDKEKFYQCTGIRRPLREVVSWNVSLSHFFLASWRRPLREVVSWNVWIFDRYTLCFCRPLREVVSWNIFVLFWLCWNLVDLFVRSWVEITIPCSAFRRATSSTSSWGRELKYEALWHQCYLVEVDLLVRSWVEMFSPVLWAKRYPCRPPREVVSWNHFNLLSKRYKIVDLLVRSWVEITKGEAQWERAKRRPPREVVSWNGRGEYFQWRCKQSTSSRGRELKYIFWKGK